MADGMHHLHKRKRVHELKEPYPHPDKWLRAIDSLVFIVAMFGVVMTVPQVLEIWTTRSAASVSLISWIAYTIGALFWIVYGLLHREKPIIAIYVLYAILDGLVVLGILLYG